MDEIWYLYTMEYYSTIKKKNLDTAKNYHTKWSKSEIKRQISYDITCMWNLNYDTNEPIYETDSDIENRLVIAKWERVEGGMKWEIGIKRCKFLYIEWIINKVLLYSTELYSISYDKP